MRKSLFTLVFATCMAMPAMACEVCGCSSGGSALGILPQFGKNFAGLRYSYRQFHTIHPPSIIPGLTGQHSDEYFHTLEAWARFYPAKRLQIFGFVPVHFYSQRTPERSDHIHTIGDITLMANYIFIKAPDSTDRKARHNFQSGLSVKMPTGRYDIKADGELLNPNLQPGTGSWDVIFNTAYTVRWKSWGIHSEALYRLNTANSHGYKFGDRVTAATKAFYVKEWKKLSLIPAAGAMYEYAFTNADQGSRVSYTGGNVLSVQAGADLYWNRFSVGINVQAPVWQDLSDGYVYAYPKINTQVMFLF